MHQHRSVLLARLHCQHRGIIVSIDVMWDIDRCENSKDISERDGMEPKKQGHVGFESLAAAKPADPAIVRDD